MIWEQSQKVPFAVYPDSSSVHPSITPSDFFIFAGEGGVGQIITEHNVSMLWWLT